MLKRIEVVLRKSPGIKARAIAAKLGVEHTDVNQVLYANSAKFQRDENFKWSVASAPVLDIKLCADKWLSTSAFERVIGQASPLQARETQIAFTIENDCRLMLEVLARLLALCNQLVAAGKKVTLDFKSSSNSLTYLDRIGFLGQLSSAVVVLPQRPSEDRARAFRGNNDGVVEFRKIDPKAPDQEVPRLLQASFVSIAGKTYSTAALTILGELFDNVLEHSGSDLIGFAGLQHYPKGNCIQAVISDHGQGIVGTLKPVLKKRYPAIARKLASAKDFDIALLEEVFSVGQVSSRVDADGRGLGLRRSQEFAGTYRARISVRQSDFELRIHHKDGNVLFTSRRKLALIRGTHICFDFKLDAHVNAA